MVVIHPYKTVIAGKAPIKPISVMTARDGGLKPVPAGLEVLGAKTYAVQNADGRLIQLDPNKVVVIAQDGDVCLMDDETARRIYG